MTPYQQYADQPRTFLALTGYTREEFDALIPILPGISMRGCAPIAWMENHGASGATALTATARCRR